jgi:hypothetical protein
MLSSIYTDQRKRKPLRTRPQVTGTVILQYYTPDIMQECGIFVRKCALGLGGTGSRGKARLPAPIE